MPVASFANQPDSGTHGHGRRLCPVRYQFDHTCGIVSTAFTADLDAHRHRIHDPPFFRQLRRFFEMFDELNDTDEVNGLTQVWPLLVHDEALQR